MADTEEYFPRGGQKPTTLFKQSANVSQIINNWNLEKTKPKVPTYLL